MHQKITKQTKTLVCMSNGTRHYVLPLLAILLPACALCEIQPYTTTVEPVRDVKTLSVEAFDPESEEAQPSPDVDITDYRLASYRIGRTVTALKQLLLASQKFCSALDSSLARQALELLAEPKLFNLAYSRMLKLTLESCLVEGNTGEKETG